MFPPESLKYDFWDFKQEDEKLLTTISGLSKNGESCEKSEESSSKIVASRVQHQKNFEEVSIDSQSKDDEMMINNIALLEITRRLVDDKSKVSQKFNLSAVMEDYENAQEGNGNISSISEIAKDGGNIFLDAIKDLKLYDEAGNEEPEMKAKVIFKRSEDVLEDDDEMSESDDDEMSESEDDQDQNSCSSDNKDSNEPKDEAPQLSRSRPQLNPYNQYVGQNYSQWENIFLFQLAGIQNYVKNAKKAWIMLPSLKE